MYKRAAALFVCLFCGMMRDISAQAPVGTVTGTVTDSTGAVLPSVSITITNKATSVARTLTANEGGLYSAPALLPGDYEVRCEQDGFRVLVSRATVQAGGIVTVDLRMEVGTNKEIVSVEATASQIEYTRNAVDGVITRQQIQGLPLNGRSFLNLAMLEPGVSVGTGSTSQYNTQFNVSILGGSGGRTFRVSILRHDVRHLCASAGWNYYRDRNGFNRGRPAQREYHHHE